MDTVKEIDLIELILRVLIFIKQRFKVLILVFICGGIAGGIYNQIEKHLLLYDITISSPEVSSDIIMKELQQLNHIIQDENSDSLIRKLSVSSKTFSLIKSVKVEKVTDNPEKLVLNIKTFDYLSEKDFHKFLQTYLLNNNLISQDLEYRKKEYESTVSYILAQIKKGNNPKVRSEKDLNYIFIDETPTDLYLLKNDYERKLMFLAPFLIENFPAVPQKSGTSMIMCLVIGGMVSCLLLFGFYFIKWLNTILEKRNKEQLKAIYFSKSA